MKFTTLAALCTAPLALAGTLEMDLQRRGVLGGRNDLTVGSDVKESSAKSEKSNSGKASSNSNSNNNNGQISSISQTDTTEIILIWINPGANAATTTVNSAAAASTAAAVAAATHTVIVGGTTKVYTPNSLAAAVGDMVIFEFHEQNHTATQSAFTSPCVALAGGEDTGFMANINGSVSPPPQAAFAVKVATPVWFYCRQTGHCGEGMTFSINPTANKTQADFTNLAIQQNGTGSTAGIVTTSAAAASATVSVASAVSAPPAASSVSSSGGSTGLTTGTGTTNSDGSCSCAVICAAGSIPNVAVQGLNSFGGMGGSIPASAMEITATSNVAV